jgi:ParB/RepB/Spo0J family partition protein
MAKKKFIHEVKIVKASQIRKNEYNPNVVSDEIMEQLVRRIEEEGFLQPLILRNIPPEGDVIYEIIDGEHRFNAGLALGYDELPAIIVDKDLPNAMISTINMNKLRGDFDTLKLAEVIHQLNKVYTIDELETMLGYSTDEMEGLDKLLNFDPEQFSLEHNDFEQKTDEELEEYDIQLYCNKEQFDVITEAFDLTGLDNNAESMYLISKFYLEQNGETSTE